MDIRKLLSIANSIPKDKLKTDSGLREVIREIGRKTGQSLSEKQVDEYVSKFRSMAKNESASSLLNQLTKRGISPNDINEIKKRLK